MAGSNTPRPKKKKDVKWTAKVQEFILDKMSDGLDVAQIVRSYPESVPAAKTIYRRSIENPEFGDAMNQAYTVLLMHRMDELHSVSSLTASEAYPGIDWREAEATLKRRIDEAKFVLGKMAPILSKRFDKAQKVEHSGQVEGPQIQVLNYHSPSPLPGIEQLIIDSSIADTE